MRRKQVAKGRFLGADLWRANLTLWTPEVTRVADGALQHAGRVTSESCIALSAAVKRDRESSREAWPVPLTFSPSAGKRLSCYVPWFGWRGRSFVPAT
jgi:hypothetical protein